MTPSHVLVTGGAGYIGSVLSELLLQRGYRVTILDRFFFGDTIAPLRSHENLQVVRDDIRWCDPSVMQGVDAVIDLAALSNDPAGELNPRKTLEINHQGRARTCGIAKDAGAQRYILASSCSIYGFQDDIVDETSDINPLTTYAEANRLAEVSAFEHATEGYVVTTLRQATVYGLSRRMRFDLAINGMTLSLHQQRSVRVMRDGTQWRPMVHVRDAARAFVTVLEAPAETVQYQIFNVGSDEQNLQIGPLAERVCNAVERPFQEDWYGDPDHRSYRVSFAKMAEQLGFETEVSPEVGAREIFSALETGVTCDGPRTMTVEWYKSLCSWHDVLKDVVQRDAVL